MKSEEYYTIDRAFMWARWLSNGQRSLYHRSQLIRLMQLTIPADYKWFFHLVGLIAMMQTLGKNPTLI